jgi:hypothetical protein
MLLYVGTQAAVKTGGRVCRGPAWAACPEWVHLVLTPTRAVS